MDGQMVRHADQQNNNHAEAADYWRRYLAMLNPNGQHARADV
jgi:hypothetical protein